MSLLTLLEKFPPAARFIPVRDKNPSVNGSDWQSKTLDAADIAAAWETGAAPATGSPFNGVGLVLSPPFVAIDHDGESCDRLIADLSGMSVEEALPPTLTISSGKPGRYQKIYLYDGELTHRKINTGTKGPDGKMEQLEIRRGDSKQSVIFGSHPETSGYTVTDDSDIAPLPAWVVAAANGVESVVATATPLLSIPCANNDVPPIPLERCLSKSHRALLEQGVIEGGRDNAAIEIAMDALGCERWLQWERIPYVGTALDIVTTFAQRCSPPLGSKREDHSPEQIMKSAQKSGNDKGPSTPPDGLRNVIKKWQRENRRPNTPATKSTPAVTPSPELTPDDAPPVPPVGSLRDLCIEIAGQGLQGSALNQALLEAAAAHRVQPSAARAMYEAVAEECDRADAREVVADEVKSLERDLGASIDLRRVLPGPIAEAMYQWAAAANVKPEGLLMTLLSGISARHNPKTRLRFHKSFRVPPAIWFSIVSPSGEMKSPILQAAAGTPLGRIEWELKESHDRALADWKQRRDYARRNRDESFSELPPVRQKVLGQEATYEKALDQLATQPGGYALIYDELPSLVKSLKDRISELLTLFNGTAIHKMIKGKAEDGSDRYTDIASPLIAFIGGIQPGKLREELSKGDDDGFWARFLYTYQPPSKKSVECDVFGGWLPDEDDPLVAELERVYRNAGAIGLCPSICGLDADAVALFKAFNDRIEEQRLDPRCPEPLGAILAKARGYVGRVAMSLRLIWDAHAGADRLDPKITGFMMEGAIAVMEYHLSQVRWIYANVGAGGVDSLPAKLQKILRISGGQPISASDCKRRCSELRKVTGDQIKGLFEELVELGMGRIEGAGRLVKFVSVTTSSPKVTSSLPGGVNNSEGGGDRGNPYIVRDIDNINNNIIYNNNHCYHSYHSPHSPHTPTHTPPPSPTESTPAPHPKKQPVPVGGENGNFGKHHPETQVGQGSQSLPTPVHENGQVVNNGVLTIDSTLPPRAIARFNKVTTAAELTKAIRLWGQERFDAFMVIASDDRRAFLQQLTETTND